MENMISMSTFRTLFPETDSAVTANRIHKLEKTLILCDILQASGSNKSIGTAELASLLSNFPGILFLGRPSENGRHDLVSYYYL